MKFLNPAGLWLLLGIPVLIIIYLIRPHHEERAVSSTYMWKLSQKFMKRQLPLQRLQRFLLFLLQLLLVICAAVMVARPAMITGKSTEYIAIIDASASMQIKDDNGVSRFDRAVEEAKKLTDNLTEGHRVTVILAGDTAQYLIQSADSVSRVNLALDGATCGAGGCNTEKALNLAQQMVSRGRSEVIFYTDTPAQQSRNMEVKDLSCGEWNLSVDNVEITADDDGGEYVTTVITSHNRPCSTTVGIKIDGMLDSAKAVELAANEPLEVSVSTENLLIGSIVEVFLADNDGSELDNRYILCTGYSRTYNVMVVSQSPFYLERALTSLESCSITVHEDPNFATKGYDLYIYDGIFPEEYPTDGAILQFGTDKLPEGLEVQKQVTTPARLSKSAEHHKLYTDLKLLDTTVAIYSPLTGSAKWERVLSCLKQPVCMTSVNESGQRHTVCSFDLHETNLPLQVDYVVLMKNILENSVYDLIPGSDFTVGTTIELAVLPTATDMHLSMPDGSIRALTPENGRCTVTLDTIGIHTAVVTTAAGGEFGDFFVHIPADEINSVPHGALSVVPATNADAGADAIKELWIWFAAALLLLLTLEWGVYFREQY